MAADVVVYEDFYIITRATLTLPDSLFLHINLRVFLTVAVK